MTTDERAALMWRMSRTAGDLAAAGPDGAMIRADRTAAFAMDIDALCAEVERLTRERDVARIALAKVSEFFDAKVQDEANALNDLHDSRLEIIRLTTEVERLREDAARLDWLEQNAGRVSGPANDSPRFVVWGDTDATDALGDTLRETIDAARTTGGRDA